jgi:hypothetical protein
MALSETETKLLNSLPGGKYILLAITLLTLYSTVTNIKQCNTISNQSTEINALAGTVKALEPYKKLNDGLYTTIALQNQKINDLISDSIKMYMDLKNSKLNLISVINNETNLRTQLNLKTKNKLIDTVSKYIPYDYFSNFYFDSTNKWFAIRGTFLDRKIIFEDIHFRDSITFVLTENNGYYRGFIQCFNPYSEIKKFDVDLDIKPEYKTNWYYVAGAFLGGALTVLILR